MKASNELCLDLLPNYSDFKECTDKRVVGYKLCQKTHGNYYSLITGLFRYKEKNVKQTSYHSLYEKEKIHYNTHLKDRVSMFKTKEDAINALSRVVDYLDGDVKLCLIEVELSGNDMEIAKYSNKFVTDVEVYVAPIIDRVTELSILN